MRVRSVSLGLLSSIFFAVTFVVNQLMSLAGGSWIWSASLRYLYMFPLLLIIVWYRGTWSALIHEMKQAPLRWILWSTVGFGLFYIPLCIAAAYEPAWLVAASWQFTIIAGSLLSPLFPERQSGITDTARVRSRIPVRGLAMSAVIFAGILVVELGHARSVRPNALLMGILLIVIAAFAYPLGNRKMMELCNGRLGAIERVSGMTIASLPLWIGLSCVGIGTIGLPTSGQLEQTAVVALSSGIIATILFFHATDMTKGNVRELAAVEATQSGEVVFSLLLQMIFVSWRLPSNTSLAGLMLVIVGMVGHSIYGAKSGSS
ncbi:multidrug resistance efflux transporter family protein [Alicyclobacillus ferrooxydans]|uniref:DMT family transporter n=1 Tax=Alicyclobacillus ferrooxydans TaxID=471514 RepID=UPI000A94AF88